MVVGRLRGHLALLLASVSCGGGGPSSTVGRDWQQYPAIVTVTGAAEIDVLGDLHGDPEVATRVLAAAGLIPATAPYHWTGGDRTLVLTGDVIDKGALATPLIDLLSTLEAEAPATGGRVIVTLGNHEAEFVADPTSDKTADFRNELVTLGLDPVAVAGGATRFGKWLLTRPVAAMVDGWFFSHGGNSAGMSLGEIDTEFRNCFKKDGTPKFDRSFLLGDGSLLEASAWWPKGGAAATSTIDFNLAVLGAQHLVFGHEPGQIDFADDPAGDRQPGEMAMRYGGRLFLVDVGMSYAVGFSKGALLRITHTPDSATAVFPDGTTQKLWP